MKRKLLLALPSVLMILWVSYILLIDWATLPISTILLLSCSILFALHFIFVQILGKFIDILDGAKIKPITLETLPRFKKMQKISGVFVLVVLVLIFVFKR